MVIVGLVDVMGSLNSVCYTNSAGHSIYTARNYILGEKKTHIQYSNDHSSNMSREIENNLFRVALSQKR